MKFFSNPSCTMRSEIFFTPITLYVVCLRANNLLYLSNPKHSAPEQERGGASRKTYVPTQKRGAKRTRRSYSFLYRLCATLRLFSDSCWIFVLLLINFSLEYIDDGISLLFTRLAHFGTKVPGPGVPCVSTNLKGVTLLDLQTCTMSAYNNSNRYKPRPFDDWTRSGTVAK